MTSLKKIMYAIIITYIQVPSYNSVYENNGKLVHAKVRVFKITKLTISKGITVAKYARSC